MTRKLATAAAVLCALSVTACTTTSTTTGGSTSKTGTAAKSSAPVSKPKKTSTAPGKLLAAGFGQGGQYVWATSLVQNTSGRTGQFVTVQFNLLNAKGKIVKSDSQVEQFSAVDEKLVLGTQFDVAKAKVSKVVATLSVGADDDSATPFPTIKTTAVKVVKGEFGGLTAKFLVVNPTKKALESPRIGVICYSGSKVNGGGSGYPDLVPPSGKAAVEVDLITSGKPSRCEAHAGPPA